MRQFTFRDRILKRRGTLTFLLSALCLIFSGCSFGLDITPDENTQYVIPLADEVSGSFAPTNLSLLVRDTEANHLINSSKILFSRERGTRGSYKQATWVEPPPRRFSTMLIQTLDKTNLFKNVSRSSSGVLGDVQLYTEILEFYHDATSSPGSATVSVIAELIDVQSLSVISRKRFDVNLPIEEYSAAGAVEGMSKGVSKVLKDMPEWLSQSLAGRAKN